MLNVGSSTRRFRTVTQPWIDQYVFKPIRERGHLVQHLDIKDAPGVDIVGDLTESRFLEELSRKEFRSVLCASLLEHVHNREEICRALVSVIPVGGHVFVSCPHKYPYHADPMDTMFRPDLAELAALFPQTRVVDGEMLTCGTYLDSVTRSLSMLVRTVVRIFLPIYRPRGWLTVVSHLPWLLRHYQIACLVLQKCAEGATC